MSGSERICTPLIRGVQRFGAEPEGVEGRVPSGRFFRSEALKLKIFEPEPVFKNFESCSWSQREFFKNCEARDGAAEKLIKNLGAGGTRPSPSRSLIILIFQVFGSYNSPSSSTIELAD